MRLPRLMRTLRCLRVLATVGLLIVCSTAATADWPMYGHDVARSCVTPDRIATPLTLQWAFRALHAPQPAWGDPKPVPVEDIPELRRVHFDDVFHPVVAGGSVLFASSANGKVYCVDAATGKTRWTFLTGGPVRLAPTVDAERVYIGSDDGCVYCLRLSDGAEVWRMRAAPEDRRVLGHGRMISLWPVRTGVLVDDGVAYFAAGIFPAESVFLYAVDAATGKEIWRNDTTGENPRSRISPQGYLLASPGTLYAPMGRVSPAAFDRRTGRLKSETSFGKRVGGSYALLVGDDVFTGTEELIGYHGQTRDQFAAFPGRRIVVTDTRYFVATNTHLLAMDRQRRSTLWKTECELADALILAGDTLLAGGAGRVTAISATDGHLAWSAEVDGAAKGLAAADGQLIVSTDTGRVYCFGPQGAPQHGERVEAGAADALADAPHADMVASAAEEILKRSGQHRGYCLVLGCQTGQLAAELAQRSELHVCVVDASADNVAAARRTLDETGLLGSRITVEQWPWDAVPYADYFANLVVSETALLTGRVPGDAAEVYRMLKPLGGTMLIGQPAPRHDTGGQAARATDGPALKSSTLHDWFAAGELTAQIDTDHGTWATLIRGPIEGAGNWTHLYANPGNTACSDDLAVEPPMGVLWFGRPGPGKMPNRHVRAASSLVFEGRLLVQGENVVMAYDAYNGLKLWERDIPGAYRPDASHDAGNLAVTRDGMFVAVDERCLRLDLDTGATLATYKTPDDAGGSQRWGYLACVDGVLLGTESPKRRIAESLFAIDVATGKQRWVYRDGAISHNSIAVGDGRVHLVAAGADAAQRETAIAEQRKIVEKFDEPLRTRSLKALEKPDVRRVVALDLQSGEPRWTRPMEVTHCGGNDVAAMVDRGVLVLFGVYLDGHYWQQFFAGEFATRRVTTLGAADGQTLWSKPVGFRVRPVIVGDTLHTEPWAFDLYTGESRQRTNPITGEPDRWQFARPGHHCGLPLASKNTMFFRSWNLGYYDLQGDYGTMHFGGQRTGCWINFLPAAGLVIMPEASTGCMCDFPNMGTVVFQPQQQQKAWAWYSTPGALTPVERLALNFGAPGDRRDADGRLWLGYPRPAGPLVLSLEADAAFYGGGRFETGNSVYQTTAETDRPWLFASAAKGLRRCSIPLLEPGDGKALYRVRLMFADHANTAAAQRVFDVKVQDRLVEEALDVVAAAGGPHRAATIELNDVAVDDDLRIELIAKTDAASPERAPLLCAVEIERSRFVGLGCRVAGLTINDRSLNKPAKVHLANLREAAFNGTLQFAPPAGFAVSPAPHTVELASGDRSVVDVSIRVTPGTPAGEYAIPVRLLRDDGSVELERVIGVEHLGPMERVVVRPSEDAHVIQRYPDRKLGTSNVLLIDGGNKEMGDRDHALAYFKFPLADLPGKPVRARLRIVNAGNPTGDSGRICLVEADWQEKAVTYATRPKLGREVARLGSVVEHQELMLPLDADLTGLKQLSLAIEPTSRDGVDYLSREGGAPAELIIDCQP